VAVFVTLEGGGDTAVRALDVIMSMPVEWELRAHVRSIGAKPEDNLARACFCLAGGDMKMKRRILNRSLGWSAQLRAGLVLDPEVEVPAGEVIRRCSLGVHLEGALLAWLELAKADYFELVAGQGESSQVGLVSMVGGRLFSGGFRGGLLVSRGRKGPGRISAGGKE
jgi:hypothetical protein